MNVPTSLQPQVTSYHLSYFHFSHSFSGHNLPPLTDSLTVAVADSSQSIWSGVLVACFLSLICCCFVVGSPSFNAQSAAMRAAEEWRGCDFVAKVVCWERRWEWLLVTVFIIVMQFTVFGCCQFLITTVCHNIKHQLLLLHTLCSR
jgi:hypothetical protein